MKRYSRREIRILGAIMIVVLVLLIAASFNLSKLPGLRGDVYLAEFSDASGLSKDSVVQIAGINVGQVDSITIKADRAVVRFELDHGRRLGSETVASIGVLNLIGEKYLDLTPAGGETMQAGDVIPLERTSAAYDIVGVLGDLSTTTEEIDTRQLGSALDTLAGTLSGSSEEIQASFDGLSRLSRTIATRDDELESLLQRASSVTRLLAERRGDFTTLIREGDLVFQELDRRREAIHAVLVHTRRMASELSGLVVDNTQQLAPALTEIREALTFLQRHQRVIEKSIATFGPYISILGNVIGTGPWFDVHIANLVGTVTGEFTPGEAP
jgi:phospholipid/cholesterol/gamma-HCH transport system substrate-binding protein